MAEDQSQQADETAADAGAGAGREPDYKALWEKSQADLERAKANSRKWEDRSKANADKARAYDASQEKAKTVEERLGALERENAGLRAARDRAALVVGRPCQTAGSFNRRAPGRRCPCSPWRRGPRGASPLAAP